MRGSISAASAAEADAYFASRARGSQAGAWASAQSRPIANRAELETALAQVEERFASGDIPRPPFWGGYRLTPLAMEFWADRPYRLHDRLLFQRTDAAASWTRQRLSP